MKYGVIRTDTKQTIANGIDERFLNNYYYYTGAYEDVEDFARNNKIAESVKYAYITITNLNGFIFNNIHFYNGLMQKAKGFNGYKYNAVMKSCDIREGDRTIFPGIILKCRNLEDYRVDVQVFITNTIVCQNIHYVLGI